MCKKIHPSDIDQEKQVFEVTLPKFNLENIYICIGNDYEHNKTHVRYNIYNVDKSTRKVTENIGYFEFTKDKDRSEMMDSDGDFKVMELGEENMTIHDEFIAKMSKSQRVKGTKPPKKAAEVVEVVQEESEVSKPFVPLDAANADEDRAIEEYFNNDKELKSAEIVPTFMTNFIKPRKWVNSVGVFMTALHTDVYIIVISEGVRYTEGIPPAVVKADPGDGDLINFQMKMYPILEGVEHDPAKKYVMVLYEPRTHYKLIEHEGKVLFNENELPQKIIDRVCKPHHETQVKGVENSLKLGVIKTADEGDCFFDSIYRATKNVDDVHAPKNEYVAEVHEFRKEIAEGVKGNKLVERSIKELYNLFSQADLNTIRDKFYLGKNGNKPESGDNEDTIFQAVIVIIFKMYEETDLTYAEKDKMFTNYLTLLYRIYPGVKSVDSEEFNKFSATYTQLYRKGNRDVNEPLDIQEQELQKVLNPKVEAKSPPKAKEPEPPVVEAPPPAPLELKLKKKSKPTEPVAEKPEPPKPAPPAPEPVAAPELPKPVVVAEEPAVKKVNIPPGTDAVIASILEIYNSSDSVEGKKQKLEKLNVTQLKEAWDKYVAKNNPELVQPREKKKAEYINCLANDPNNTCKKETKKKGGNNRHNTTRKKI
jgi:hypothetical protein